MQHRYSRSSATLSSTEAGVLAAGVRESHNLAWETWIAMQVQRALDLHDLQSMRGPRLGASSHDYSQHPFWLEDANVRASFIPHLPSTIQLRKDVEEAHTRITEATSEEEVCGIVRAINATICRVNRYGAEGPPSTEMPFDLDIVLSRWRLTHPQ